MVLASVLETGVVTGLFLYTSAFLYHSSQETWHFNFLGCTVSLAFLLTLHSVVPLLNKPASDDNGTGSLYRSASSPGLWCSLFIPMSLTTQFLQDSEGDSMEVILSLVTVVLVLVHFNPSSTTQVTAALILLWFRSEFLMKSKPEQAIFTFVCAVFYILMGKFPRHFPKSFTEGELSVLLQVFVLPLYRILITGYKVTYGGYSVVVNSEDGHKYALSESSYLTIAAYVGITAGSVFIFLLQVTNKSVRFYSSYGLATVTVLLVLNKSSIHNPVEALIVFVLKTNVRIKLLSWWTFLVSISILVTVMVKRLNTLSTWTRKCFHVLIVAVFVPGVIYDQELLLTSSVVVFGIMIIIETVRVMDVFPLSEIIKQHYVVFLDKQDEGSLILTPIYLLCGMSFPLWIQAVKGDNFAPAVTSYAGILSVGIGDAMASVFGRHLGKNKIPGTQKTIEGTLSSIISQILFIFGISFLVSENPFQQHIVAVCLAVVVTAVLEACTSQIDNHILPLFMYNILVTLKS